MGMGMNPIGGGGCDGANQVAPNDWRTRTEQMLDPVAKLFGETTDQLMSELQSGNTSLSALASSKGISQDDLIGAIKQGLQSTNNGQQLSATQLTNLADRVASRTHGHHHQRGLSIGPTSIKADVERLMADLRASQSSDGSSDESGDGSSSSSDLLQQLTQFDQSI